jgi:hypothetical protein
MLQLIDRIAWAYLNWRIDQATKRIDVKLNFKKATLTQDGWFGEWVSPMVAFIADQCSDMLNKAGAPNYVQFDMIAHAQRPVRVTVQWADGESPAEQNARLRKELERQKGEL